MASVIKAGNATDGVQVTSDNTGILELKTGTGSGTTAVTIGTDQSVTFAGRTTNPTTISVGNATPSTSGSGITFPATQSASTDANTLDDYEEGTWTPTITYATPGTLSVSYTTQEGAYTKIGNIVILNWGIRLSAFTKGTASGELRIGGVPFSTNFDTPIGTLGLYNSSFTTQPVSVPGAGFISLLRMVSNSAWVNLDDPDSNAQYFGTVVIRVA